MASLGPWTPWAYRLPREIGQALTVAVEQIGGKIDVTDEKYQDIPGRVLRLERDVEELKGGLPPPASTRKRSR